jgi:F-type H+-transporting ATPase subunit delta
MSEKVTHHSARETVFDVDVEKLARVYAQAGLDAAGDHKAQQSFVDELRDVVYEVLAKYPGLEKVFGSALVSSEDKLGVIDRVFGKSLSKTALNFVKVIARHGRLEILQAIVRRTIGLWSERLNQVTVRLELAHPIDAALQKEMIALIAKRLNKEPIVSVEINPDLIAGFVVRAGDRVLDASIRTNLERARHAMIEKAIAVIEQRPEKYVQGVSA